MSGSMKMLASKSNDKRRSDTGTLDKSRHSFCQCPMFFSELLRIAYGLTLQPGEEPLQVEIIFRGAARLSIRAFDH